jgi:two-component system response regulator AtoC
MKQFPIQLQSLIDVQENPFVLIDEHYQIVAANKSYCDTYGFSPDGIVGQLCHQVSHHSDTPCHLNGEDCPHRQVFQTGNKMEVLHTHYDQLNRPEHVRIKGHAVRGQNGELYLGEAIFPFADPTDIDCDEMRMIGRSPAFLNCVENLTNAAESEAPILLFGESGVGKELAAQYVHKRSTRANRSFVAVDCAAISESLFESELFGHERGAFTGCIGRKQGLFELADNGTLFMDEIGEIPLTLQAKLLRVLESGEFRRVGGRETLKADVRLVSATNRDLLDMVDQGKFRLDLYYRISGIDIRLPPLRERLEDIPALAQTILGRISLSRKIRYRLTGNAISKLITYDYPGNVRELRNILQKAAALSDGLIRQEHILVRGARKAEHLDEPAMYATVAALAATTPTAALTMTAIEARYISELLEKHNGHRRTVAEILGISERTLYRKLKSYQLPPDKAE